MFITAEEVKGLSSFEEVKALSNEQIETYMARADSWIRRATNSPAIELSDNEALQKDMRLATWLLVEYLVYWDDPDNKEDAISQEDNVRIGSYSYSLKPNEGDYLKTGIRELDGILEAWRYSWNFESFFKVSGPSRK